MYRFLILITIIFVFTEISNAAISDQFCLDHIKNVTYYSKNSKSGPDFEAQRFSDPKSLKNLIDLYLSLPDIQKKVLCHIDRIQIHESLESLAYANYGMTNKGSVTSYSTLIGFRKSTLDNIREFDLFSWKEQLNFNLSSKDDPYYSISDLGPKVQILMDKNKVNNPELFYVLIHEINHLIDFMNKANNFECDNNYLNCVSLKGSFSNLSFERKLSINGNSTKSIFHKIYPVLDGFCFYNCQSFMDVNLIHHSYDALKNTSFLTSYASTDVFEDFAESATAYLLQSLDIGYNMIIRDSSNREIYNQNKHFHDPDNSKMRLKRQWLENFFNRSDIKFKFK